MAYRDDFASGPGGVATRERVESRRGDQAFEREPLAEPLPSRRELVPASPEPVPQEPPAAPEKASKPLRKLLVLVVLAAALAYGGYRGYEWWTVGRFFVSTDDAYVQADITVLAAKVSGYIASVEVTNNQSVRAGDVVARIDDGDYRLAVQTARDKLGTQDATIARIGRQAEAARASAAQAAAQIDAAKADLVRASGDYARQLQLAQSAFASKARLEQSKSERDRADASVKSAEAALAAANANVDVLAAQRTEAERVAVELRTAAEKAERDLSFTTIRAPIDGVIGNKAAEIGTFVQPGTRLAALVPLASVHVDANFKETQLARLQPGQPVRVEVDALPGREIVGTVESVSPASGSVFSLLPPENATGNFTKIVQRVPVRVRLPSDLVEQGLLRPGMSVVAAVDTRGPATSGQGIQASAR